MENGTIEGDQNFFALNQQEVTNEVRQESFGTKTNANNAGKRAATKSASRHCKFFATARGCKKQNECEYRHEIAKTRNSKDKQP